MLINCPAPPELMATALGGPNESGNGAIERHIETCVACKVHVDEIRKMAAMLHAVPSAPPSSRCLDNDAIAELADGRDSSPESDALAHAAGCASCRARLAAVVNLLGDATIMSEINLLQHPRRLRRHGWHRTRLAITGGLAAAAAAAIVLLDPVRSGLQGDRVESEAHREAAITATTAPRIVSPADITGRVDSLRWTSVAQADLYRVRVWDLEGSVVWTVETPGTGVAMPQVIQVGRSYLWEVSARTGWDRWVSSDFVEFTLRPSGVP